MSNFFYLVLIILVTSSEAAKILAYFPVPSISHQVVFRPLVHELARRGHEVTIVTTDPAFPKGQAPGNLTEIDVHDVSYDMWHKALSTKMSKFGEIRSWTKQTSHFSDLFVNLLETHYALDEVKAAIFDKSKKYDLLILEACMYGTLGLSHLFKVPVIQFSSFGPLDFNLHTVGAPFHVFRQPLPFQHRLKPYSMWDRLNELFIYFEQYSVYRDIDVNFNKMLKKVHGPNTPDLNALRKNVDMLFLNEHPLWELNRPMPPNVIFMGGLHQISQKELPIDLKTFLDNSKHGVIYVSFGTNVDPRLLPLDRIETLVKAFSKLPNDILWKWNGNYLPGQTANIKISKWLPQSDLLRHPKIKLFITQCGLQSTDEAITAGVPLIGIPMIGDQWYNAELYVYHKIGLRLDLYAITERSLTTAITTVIKDESYRKNIAKLQTVMRDQVQSPLERAVWWTEYVLRHGGAKHLRSPLANLSWADYLELDLVLVLVVAMISAILISILVMSYLYKLLQHTFSIKLKTV